MSKQDRYEEKHYKLVAREKDVFVFLDYVFKHKDGFQGATGTKLRPVPKNEYDERMNDAEQFKDRWKDAVANNITEASLEGYLEEMGTEEKENWCWDTSYRDGSHDLWKQVRDMGYNEEEYPTISCEGGGRCFTSTDEWDEIYNQELWDLICQYERPNEKVK